MGTSSADPGKLDEYVLTHMAWVNEMRTKIQAFVDQIDAYNGSADVIPKINPDLAANLHDHIERWAHLGDFVADVSRGFHDLINDRYDTPTGAGIPGPPFTFNDASIGRAGQVGYADRQAAIDSAEDAAERLQDFIDEHEGDDLRHMSDETEADLNAIIEDIGQGQ